MDGTKNLNDIVNEVQSCEEGSNNKNNNNLKNKLFPVKPGYNECSDNMNLFWTYLDVTT